MIFGFFVEYVGRSKVLGGVYDVLYYNKLLLIFSFYVKIYFFNGLIVVYYGNEKEGSEGICILLSSFLEI